MASTVPQFLKTLQDSGLLGRDRFEEVARELGGPRGEADASTVAGVLVGRGLLTSWQASQLLEGVHQGFFLGPYKLLGHVASGGRSAVFEAEHLRLHRRVALKVLPRSLVGESGHLERFDREARAVARLEHPNIVRGFEVGRDGDRHFLAMEFVEGSSLEQLVERSGPLPIERAVEMARQASLGLGHAHEAGLVHRDIRPANLLLDRAGTLKILDLGLARSRLADHREEASPTRANEETVLGTVDYLSPEQAIDGHEVDIRSDIYSLGCTLYFLLTGAPPFSLGTLAERLMAHQTRSPTPPSALRAEVPADLDQIVARMMAKRPGARYQTPREVSDLLGDWLLGRAAPGPEPAGVADSPDPPSGGSARSRRNPVDAGQSPKPRPPSIPASPRAIPSSSGSRASPALSESWTRWARVFEVVAARRKPRLPLGEASYRLIHDRLLMDCRNPAGDESSLEFRRQVEQFVAPCLTLDALGSILRSEMRAVVVKRFHEIDRTLRPRPWLTPRRRLFLKVGALVAAVTLIGSSPPASKFLDATSRATRTALHNARSALRDAHEFQERIRGIR